MAAERPSRRLPRSARLKHRRDFAEVRRDGQRLVNGCLIANWRILPTGSGSRVGVVTSRRLGSAVTRARARRLLRETFRLHQISLRQPVAMVLIARQSIVGRGLAEVERDFLAALRRARLMNDTD
jgi:ribonuclease P protein component